MSAVLLAALLAGCANPDAPGRPSAPAPRSVQNAGEPAAPRAPSAQAESPAAIQSTPERALSAFAQLYVNWSYRTLAAHQRTLAAISLGPARLSESQAAARGADAALIRGHVYNRGQVVGISHDLSRPRWWIVVTHEQTGGSSQYEGLPAAYHVTRARLTGVSGGYAVQEWQPQS